MYTNGNPYKMILLLKHWYKKSVDRKTIGIENKISKKKKKLRNYYLLTVLSFGFCLRG